MLPSSNIIYSIMINYLCIRGVLYYYIGDMSLLGHLLILPVVAISSSLLVPSVCLFQGSISLLILFQFVITAESSLLVATIVETIDKHSRIFCNMKPTRRLTATKCGSHRMGDSGSVAIDSLSRSLSFFSLWKLKIEKRKNVILLKSRLILA